MNVERRLYEHNSGHSKFTSIGVPWRIVHLEEYSTLKEAKARERQIKSMKSKKYIEGLVSKGEGRQTNWEERDHSSSLLYRRLFYYLLF